MKLTSEPSSAGSRTVRNARPALANDSPATLAASAVTAPGTRSIAAGRADAASGCAG